jgi:exonuclease VII large subunit
MAKKSTQDQIDRMRLGSSVKAPKDFAKIRDKLSNKPVSTLSEVIPEIQAHNKALPLLKEADKISRLNEVETITKEALEKIKPTSKLPSDVIYNKTGKLTDLGGKPAKFTKLRSLVGLLPAAASAAIAAYAPESKAATIAQKVADEGDPTSVLFPGGAGEGEEEEIAKMREEQQNKYLDDLMKNVPKNQKMRSESQNELNKQVDPLAKMLGGYPILQEKDAKQMAGEMPSGEEDLISIENSDRKLRKKLGY